MTSQNVMAVIEDVGEMKAYSNALRKEGKSIALVPTMGALHEGHLSLMREGRKRADILVVSIFVNPTQFGPSEDYNKYMRDKDGDLEKIKDIGVDTVFMPGPDEVYPPGFQTYVQVEELEKPLCGALRPGHFRGVATVVLKLFNIVKADVALFGQKDYQQWKIIERMVRDLDLDIEILGLPIVREETGLAMSSRNAYLSDHNTQRALSLSRALLEIKSQFANGTCKTDSLVDSGKRVLERASVEEIDYLEIRDGETLQNKHEAARGDVAAVAARVGGARLIDNIIL
jgi:pantoate--beta-alanine ligase